MLDTSQDVLYVTVSVCVAVFTVFLVWIMYYVAQISRQSNEMITDFREKVDELDAAVREMKDKLSTTIDNVGAIGEQVSYILEIVRGVGSKVTKRKR